MYICSNIRPWKAQASETCRRRARNGKLHGESSRVNWIINGVNARELICILIHLSVNVLGWIYICEYVCRLGCIYIQRLKTSIAADKGVLTLASFPVYVVWDYICYKVALSAKLVSKRRMFRRRRQNHRSRYFKLRLNMRNCCGKRRGNVSGKSYTTNHRAFALLCNIQLKRCYSRQAYS